MKMSESDSDGQKNGTSMNDREFKNVMATIHLGTLHFQITHSLSSLIPSCPFIADNTTSHNSRSGHGKLLQHSVSFPNQCIAN